MSESSERDRRSSPRSITGTETYLYAARVIDRELAQQLKRANAVISDYQALARPIANEPAAGSTRHCFSVP